MEKSQGMGRTRGEEQRKPFRISTVKRFMLFWNDYYARTQKVNKTHLWFGGGMEF